MSTYGFEAARLSGGGGRLALTPFTRELRGMWRQTDIAPNVTTTLFVGRRQGGHNAAANEASGVHIEASTSTSGVRAVGNTPQMHLRMLQRQAVDTQELWTSTARICNSGRQFVLEDAEGGLANRASPRDEIQEGVTHLEVGTSTKEPHPGFERQGERACQKPPCS